MTDEQQEERTLEDVCTDLGKADVRWKEGSKDREKFRDEFFTLALEEVESETLAQKTVSVEAGFEDADAAKAWLAKYYPTWRFVEWAEELDEDGNFVAILEEDPYYQSYSFTNPRDGKVYKRKVTSGSPVLDDERLRERDPELWERITHVPEPQRQLRPETEIDADDLAAMQEYTYMSKPQIQLPAPTKAKK